MQQQNARLMTLINTMMTELEKCSHATILHAQCLTINNHIRMRATMLCNRYDLDTTNAGRILRNAIKKDLLRAYGIKDLHDLPLRWYDKAIDMADNWVSLPVIRKVRDNP